MISNLSLCKKAAYYIIHDMYMYTSIHILVGVNSIAVTHSVHQCMYDNASMEPPLEEQKHGELMSDNDRENNDVTSVNQTSNVQVYIMAVHACDSSCD